MGVRSDGAIITANTGEDSFFFLGKKEMDFIGAIKLGDGENSFGPHGMKVDENKQYLYVANSYNRTISVIDCINQKVVQHMGVGTSPCHLELCKENEYIYVSNYDSDSVYVLDLKKKVPAFKIEVGRMPHDVKIIGKHNFLYVTESGGDSIGIINTQSNDYEGNIPMKNTPLHLQAGSSGEFLFAGCSVFEQGNYGEICIIDTKDHKLIERYQVGHFISDLCICEKRKSIYAVDGETGYLYEIDLENGRLKNKTQTGDFPSCIEIDRTNQLLVVGTHMDGAIETYHADTLSFIGREKVGKDMNHFIFYHT